TEGDVVDCIMDQQFFFASRRRHTRFSRDWSSDVCSSDLADGIAELSTTLNQTGAVRQSGGYGGKPLRLPGEGVNHRDNTTGGRMAQGSAAAKSNAASRVFTEGMRVLWTAIRTEPPVFTAALLGALLYAAASVASASVLGAVSEQVILPAVENGRTTTAAVATAAAAVFGVGALRALGLGARRFYAGLMQFRMQARYRRAVARKYLQLPLSWHQRHPAGQLLSNANADVEAAWQPLAPLPMAVGSVAMLLIAAVAMLVTDPVLALVGFVVFPTLAVANIVFQRRVSPAATRAQALRSQVSEVAHESFD